VQNQTRAASPGAVRLPEVVTAVLDVLDARGVKAGQQVAFVELEVGMDARGYPIKWVRRAVAVLVNMGVLRNVAPVFAICEIACLRNRDTYGGSENANLSPRLRACQG
jgi:hypothetical protein